MRCINKCNGLRTHNHLVHKRTLNHLAKLAIWLKSCVFINELSGSGFECRYSHLNFRYCACFEQEVP